MTEDERKNRNPAPEVARYNPDDHPPVTASELELHRVYVLEGPRRVATMNYMGLGPSLDTRTWQPCMTHQFRAPRIGLDVFLMENEDGSLRDGDGNRITLRRWTGPDA